MRKEVVDRRTSRRRFLQQVTYGSGMAVAVSAGLPWTSMGDENQLQSSTTKLAEIIPGKTVLSFYVDDTTPYTDLYHHQANKKS
jgi:hypothetical protein